MHERPTGVRFGKHDALRQKLITFDEIKRANLSEQQRELLTALLHRIKYEKVNEI